MPDKLTGSIVVYNNRTDIVLQAIDSFLEGTKDAVLYVIDNSPTDQLRECIRHGRVRYLFNEGKNMGFGKAHNVALQLAQQSDVSYHVVLNPDVYFDSSVIRELTALLDQHPEIGLAMPKVLFPDGRLQYLCKLLPTPAMLFMRRFFRIHRRALEASNKIYELQFSGYNKLMDVPFLSGCFMFLRMEAIKRVGGFDENIFLYTEDVDLTRRIHQYYRTVFYPQATIYHIHEKASYKSARALVWHIKGAITYFNKWGWFFDPERKKINRSILLKLTQ